MPDVQHSRLARKRGRRFPLKLLLALAMIGAIVWFLWVRAGRFPLARWDEDIYLGQVWKGISPVRAPPYTLWYTGLRSIVGNDPLLIYRVSHGILLFGVSALAFITLYLEGVSLAVNLLGSAALLFWLPWTTVPVQLNHFDLMLVLLALVVFSQLARNLEECLLWLGVSLLALCYVRQDNLVVSLGLFASAGVFRFCSRIGRGQVEAPRGVRGPSWLPAILCSVAIVASLVLWSPYGKDRGWRTFADYYFWSSGERVRTQEEVIRSAFGDHRTIIGAALENPQAFSDFVVNNWRSGLTYLKKSGTPFEPVVVPWLILGLVFGLVTQKPGWRGPPGRVGLALGILTLWFGLRAVISISLFRAEFRYCCEFLVLSWLCLLAVLPVTRNPVPAGNIPVVLALSIAFLVAAPKSEAWYQGFREYDLQFTELVQKLQTLPRERRQSWFASDAYFLFLGDPLAPHDCAYDFHGPSDAENVSRWIKEVGKRKHDVIVFDQNSDGVMKRFLGVEGAATLKKNLVTSCHEIWHDTLYAQVYLRKKGCFAD